LKVRIHDPSYFLAKQTHQPKALLLSGELVWPGEIPPSWELEWVDGDAE
jgi:hypothetical protein